MPTYYELLHLSVDASDDEVKQAFRRMARLHHPDMHQDPAAKRSAEDRFKEILQAYETLKDPLSRRSYDACLDTFSVHSREYDACGAASRPDPPHPSFSILEKTTEIQYKTLITLKQLITGWRGKAKVYRTDVCTCVRSLRHAPAHHCDGCDGHGYYMCDETFSLCEDCAGSGVFYGHFCSLCDSSTRCYQYATLVVTIPAWTRPDETITLAEGHLHPRKTTRGPFRMVFQLKEKATLVGDDLIFRIAITHQQARTGMIKVVPGLTGSFKMVIPPGLQPKTILRIPGKGLRRAGLTTTAPTSQQRGDLLYRVTIRKARKPRRKPAPSRTPW